MEPINGKAEELQKSILDNSRQNRAAYDYLCRLSEVQKWLTTQLNDEAPPPNELEINLRNGVLLARLGSIFSPNIVKTDQIFDIHEEKYKSGGLVYKHTDNIIQWRKACLDIGFPEFWIPETVDIYEGRNVRTIFCLHALALYLHRILGTTPIKNETGNLHFMPEEIQMAKQRLHAEGVTNCDFQSVNHAPVNSSVLNAVRKAIEDKSLEDFMEALSSRKCGIVFVKPPLGQLYFDDISKRYEENPDLSPNSIQECIDKVNEIHALNQLEAYLKGPRDYEALSRILTDFDPDKVVEAALPFYDDYLTVNCKNRPIEPHLLRKAMDECNACVHLKTSLREGDADDVFESLKSPHLDLEDVIYQKNKVEYHRALLAKSEDFDNSAFSMIEKIQDIVTEINMINKLRYYVLNKDPEGFHALMTRLKIRGYNPRYRSAYMTSIKENGLKSREELVKIINDVDERIKESVKDKLQNKTMDIEDIREVINILQVVNYEEEILIERRRSRISKLVETTDQLHSDIDDLEKSFQLFKNKEVSIDAVLKQLEVIQIEEKETEQQDYQKLGLQQLSLHHLEVLFYYFQTEPGYLANLFAWEKISRHDFLNSIVLPTFYFLRGEREEILLIRVFAKILTRYIGSLKIPDDFLNDEWMSIRVVAVFREMLLGLPSRGASPMSKADLSEFQKAEASEVHLNFSPMQMFEKIHQKPAKSLEEAMNDPEVSKILTSSKNFLSKWTVIFAKTAAESIEIPKTIRYLLKICANKLRRHFRDLEKTEVDRLVAKFFFSTYFEDYLQAHNKKEIDPSLTDRQREIIKLIFQMMELGAAGRGFGEDAPHMQSLNTTLIQLNDIFISLTSNHLIRQGSAFTLNRDPLHGSDQPILHIEAKYVGFIISSLKGCKDLIFVDKESPIKLLLEAAIIPKNKTVVLFLKPLHANDGAIDGGLLLVETKKMIVELLQVGCEGSNLREMLESIDDSDDPNYEAIRAKKNLILQNLSELEKHGIISPENDYQEIIRQISHDLTARDNLQNQHNRDLEAFDRKINELIAKRNEYQDQLKVYKSYLKKYQK